MENQNDYRSQYYPESGENYMIEWVCRNPIIENGYYQLVRRVDEAILFCSEKLAWVIGHAETLGINTRKGLLIY